MTVTFSSNGGSDVSSATVEYNEKVAAPTAPTKANAHFVGWYSDENLTTEFDFANTAIKADTTLYAKWNACADGNITYSEVSTDNKMTATLYCSVDTDEVLVTETVEGTYVKDTDATCTAAETGHYVYNFADSRFEDKQSEIFAKGSPLGHEAGQEYLHDETYHWHVCSHDGCEEILDKAEHSWTSEETTPATHTSDGVRTYTCTGCGLTKTEVIEKLSEHTYGEATYTWSDDNSSCVASKSCIGGDDTVTENATVTNVQTKAPTCTETGIMTYTATFTTENGFETQTKTITVPATGHAYGNLIAEVAATEDKEGMKAHYHCEECDKYFDANKQECTKESLLIAKLEKPTPSATGCGGSIAAASGLITLLSTLGIVLIKRKKEN